jgi:hypothetical protein
MPVFCRSAKSKVTSLASLVENSAGAKAYI